MDSVAHHLEQAADAMSALERETAALAVPAGALAAGEPGLPGRLGRALYAHWSAVLAARSREASTAAGRLAEMAHAVRTTSEQYTETDEAVRHRLTREL